MQVAAGSRVRVRAEPESPRAFLNAAGACTAALGTIDVVIGLSMLASAGAYDQDIDRFATAAAMRAYGVRATLAGAVSLAFVWAVFAEPGIRAAWFVLPLGIALFDLGFDVQALSSGLFVGLTAPVTAALHMVLAIAVAVVTLTGWQRERAQRRTRPQLEKA